MRQNRNQQYQHQSYNNDFTQQKEDNRQYVQNRGVHLPPIDNRQVRVSRGQNHREEDSIPEQDRFEKMRNRSRNNAERLQKLREIKSKYTRKNGGDMPARKLNQYYNGKNNQQNSNAQPDVYNSNKNSHVKGNAGRANPQQQDQDFEIYEMEHIGDRGGQDPRRRHHHPNNDDDDTRGDSRRRREQNQSSTENEIEALERELAKLKNDIREQETSIARIDEIKKLASNGGIPLSSDRSPLDDRNQVFGQRVKGKEIPDYGNGIDSKTVFKVQQVPGGQSQVQIGDAYNFFKDKENMNYINAKLGRKSPTYGLSEQQEQFQLPDVSREEGYVSAGQYYGSNARSEIGNQKRPHPNEQVYNIINHNDGDGRGLNARQLQVKQQELYSQQLREQIASNASFNTKAAKNQSTINIFEGYPMNNPSAKNDRSSPFISNLYHQQEKERRNPGIAYYNSQSTDITADGRKNVRVSQPPGGISQVTFF